MDGTITIPVIDFKKIREELKIFTGDLIEVIEKLPDEQKKKAWRIIESHEEEGLKKMRIQPDAKEVLARFKDSNIKIGLLTRNSWKSVTALIHILGIDFDTVLTREFPHVKPSPVPVEHILSEWKITPDETLVVGDYIHDIESGNKAGAYTCFFENSNVSSFSEFADYSVKTFMELEKLVL